MTRRWGIILGLAALLSIVAVAAPARSTGPAGRYIAMGDSYTAGPLIPNSTGPQGCVQSDHNYPHLAAAALAVSSFRDVSCSGATTDDFSEPQASNPPQFDALDSSVGLVTVGIGGNDVGFVGIVFDCVRFLPVPLSKPCSADLTAGGVDKVSQRIAETAPKIAASLQEIHRRAPNAVVLVVGYPSVFPEYAPGCWPYIPLLPQDVPYLRAKYKEMNAMLATQAAANGAAYVDIYTSSIGHDTCQLPSIAWVNGIVVVPLSAPAHPNVLGMRNAAVQVVAAARASGVGVGS